MTMIHKTFRIEKEIWDALVAEKQSSSRLIRLFIIAGLHQMKIPHYDEILLLTKLEEQARKVGINTNQAHYHKVAKIASSLSHCEGVEWIPYHAYGGTKATFLGGEDSGRKEWIPTPEQMEKAKASLKFSGVNSF